MPRGKAHDTLPEGLAATVRTAVIDARGLKGLTNRDLAEHLDSDDRTVTNALQSGRPLRLPTAERILRAVTKLAPWRGGERLAGKQAQLIHKEAMTILGPSIAALANVRIKIWPAALIASPDVSIFADCLTEAIVRRSGFSERKREQIKRAIVGAVMADAGKFTFAAKQRLTNAAGLPPHFKERAALHVLARFGYHIRNTD